MKRNIQMRQIKGQTWEEVMEDVANAQAKYEAELAAMSPEDAAKKVEADEAAREAILRQLRGTPGFLEINL